MEEIVHAPSSRQVDHTKQLLSTIYNNAASHHPGLYPTSPWIVTTTPSHLDEWNAPEPQEN